MSEGNRTDHIQGKILHVYDGIEEADNELPTWWLLTFYGAIVFAALYWFYYHEYEIGPHQPEVFAAQMRERMAEGGEISGEQLVMLSEDGATVASGQETFQGNCVACHGERGQGDIGPNLTDDAWIHGGAPEDIYATVRNGVATAGMPAWGPSLGDGPVQAVVAYLLTIRDTNVEGRPPEGEVYDPDARGVDEAETAEPTAAASEAVAEGDETGATGEADAAEGAGEAPEAPAEVAEEPVEEPETAPAALEAPTEEAALEGTYEGDDGEGV